MARQELQLDITDSMRLNVQVTFQRHNFGLLSSPSPILIPCYPLSGPYVVIKYRLAIVANTLGEIWSCDMTPTAHGFSVNNAEYFIRIHVSPHGLVLVDTQDHDFRTQHGSTGVVTLLLPSSRAQLFENTVKLISATSGRHRCVSCIHQVISVPGPQLEEYQEGPGIEKPIKKIRPNGMWSNAVGMEIVKRLQRLADDGMRDVFKEVLQRLEEVADGNSRFIDLIPLALYELAMLDLHENRVKEAEEHTKKALEIMKTYHSTNGRFLLSKLKYVQSALARRMGDYSTARELLEDSVELLLPCGAGEETAENRYFLAAYYVEKAAKVGITDQEQAIAERCFRDVDRHLSAETRPITNRFQIRSKNRQIAFYVKSSRHIKNLDVQRVVSEEHMAKAFQLIWEIETSLLMFYPKKPLMSFHIVKTDYYIRRGSLELGIEPSQEALKIAIEKGWYEYVEVADQRLQLCRRGHPFRYRETPV